MQTGSGGGTELGWLGAGGGGDDKTGLLDLSSLEQAMAKLNTSDFEWAMAGLGELGTRATAVGLNSDGGAWGRLKQETCEWLW